MSKYYQRSRENRFQNLPSVIKSEGDFVLVITQTGIPFIGEVVSTLKSFDVHGKIIVLYHVYVEELGITIMSDDKRYTVSTLNLN